MDYAVKDGVTVPLGAKMPGTYESERVTYGDSNVKDELDAINSNLTIQIIADEATYSLVKTGNICVFTISGIVPTSGIYNAYSIPLACRPNKITRGVVTSDDCANFARVTVETNTVAIYNATSSVAMYGQVVWTV